MSFNPVTFLPCGCRTIADYYGVEIKHCALHAAAPDLLAACKAALLKFNHSPLDKMSVAADMIRAAVAKAEGRTA